MPSTQNPTHISEPSLGSENDFKAFSSQYLTDAFVAKVASRNDTSFSEARDELETYLNEALVGLSVLSRHLPHKNPGRILEVGAGLRILSLYLSHRGFDVTALEPIGPGFSFFDIAGELIWNNATTAKPARIDAPANALSSLAHGRFDFIFSIHVLEHIDELNSAIDAISSVLSPDGMMAHLCPNYAFPYEPHFSIPLIPMLPRTSGKLFLDRKTTESPLWSSLNFVSASRLENKLVKNGLEVSFRKGVMTEFFQRLDDDMKFASRHESGLVGLGLKIIRLLRLQKLIDMIPARLATPMELVVHPLEDQRKHPERLK